MGLTGDLGAGKTHFVKGLLAGLEGTGEATSPTFTLLHEYRGGRLPLYHFDFYRLQSRTEIEEIGFDDYLREGGVTVIEWADRFRKSSRRGPRWLRLETRDENTPGDSGGRAMKVLALELSSPVGSVASLDDQSERQFRSFPADRRIRPLFLKTSKRSINRMPRPI